LIIDARVVEADTRIPVIDADVTCELFYGETSLAVWSLQQNGSGFYSGSPNVGWPGSGQMTVVISVEKDNYQSTTREVIVIGTSMDALDYVTTILLPQLAVIAVFGAIVAGSYRINKKRQIRIRKELAEVKSTFDDANNLLGILILHKNSGLPFYSKILKGGFEEGMLSAFVTAVTHFRAEFEENGADREWKLTPISDIIRAGATRNLICAFVTITSPSLVHEAKMVMFTREIGLLLDDRMEVPPTEFRDDDTGRIIDDMFDDYLDGYFLKEYRISIEGALPRKYRCISEARAVAGLGDTFSLSELSRGLEACGIEETRGYKLISDAVEGGYVWAIKKDVEDSFPGFSE